MNKQRFLLLAIVIGFSLAIGGEYNLVDAETYRDFDGKLISEEQYVQRVNICEGLQNHNNLDKEINCMEYALSKAMHDHWVLAYQVSERFEQFLDNNDLIVDNNLSDILPPNSP
jgi:hypothetical protein